MLEDGSNYEEHILFFLRDWDWYNRKFKMSVRIFLL